MAGFVSVEVKARRNSWRRSSWPLNYREAAADARSFQQDVAAGQKTAASLHAALKSLHVGAATSAARCGQWSKGSCKQQAASSDSAGGSYVVEAPMQSEPSQLKRR